MLQISVEEQEPGWKRLKQMPRACYPQPGALLQAIHSQRNTMYRKLTQYLVLNPSVREGVWVGDRGPMCCRRSNLFQQLSSDTIGETSDGLSDRRRLHRLPGSEHTTRGTLNWVNWKCFSRRSERVVWLDPYPYCWQKSRKAFRTTSSWDPPRPTRRASCCLQPPAPSASAAGHVSGEILTVKVQGKAFRPWRHFFIVEHQHLPTWCGPSSQTEPFSLLWTWVLNGRRHSSEDQEVGYSRSCGCFYSVPKRCLHPPPHQRTGASSYGSSGLRLKQTPPGRKTRHSIFPWPNSTFLRCPQLSVGFNAPKRNLTANVRMLCLKDDR